MLSFEVRSIVAASLAATMAVAQLPRECFYVMEMQEGVKEKEAMLLSNLPTLMAMFNPEMRLKSIVAQHDELESTLTGLQVNLTSKMKGDLQLPSVDTRVDGWTSQKFDFSHGKEPDMISILTHPDYGVCDVIVNQDS